jgi:hypothetical protein
MCVCVCVCVCLYLCLFVFSLYMYIYRWACVRAAHTCVKVHKYTSVCVCMCVYCDYMRIGMVLTGYNDVGFRNSDVITPNIDSLASDGLILDQSYVQPLCTPSRDQCYEAFYGCKLRLFKICYSICSWQAFPA